MNESTLLTMLKTALEGQQSLLCELEELASCKQANKALAEERAGLREELGYERGNRVELQAEVNRLKDLLFKKEQESQLAGVDIEEHENKIVFRTLKQEEEEVICVTPIEDDKHQVICRGPICDLTVSWNGVNLDIMSKEVEEVPINLLTMIKSELKE